MRTIRTFGILLAAVVALGVFAANALAQTPGGAFSKLSAGQQKIAQALFVTRKTVETHLGHVYRKLGISGRADLRRALG